MGTYGDFISRQKVLDILDGNIERVHDGNAYWKLPEWKRKIIDVNQTIKGQIIHMVPPVNPQPKTGHWIPISSTDMYCSECNEIEHLDTSRKFCAYCGTRMVEPQEKEEPFL